MVVLNPESCRNCDRVESDHFSYAQRGWNGFLGSPIQYCSSRDPEWLGNHIGGDEVLDFGRRILRICGWSSHVGEPEESKDIAHDATV